MIELFHMGGPLFMSILTLQLVGVLFVALRYFMQQDASTKRNLNLMRGLGLFALVTGILGQLIGLFSAFKHIEQAGSVSPAMLAGGIKVSMITTMYGAIIYLLSLIFWIVAVQLKTKRTAS